jgi:periplasmic protein TonB
MMAPATQRLAPWQSPPSHASGLARHDDWQRRCTGALMVACAHIFVACLAWLLGTVPRAAAELRPVMLAIIAPEAPRQQQPPRLPQTLRQAPQPAPPKLSPLPAPALHTPENTAAIPLPATPQPPAPAVPAPAPVATPPAPPPAAQPAPARKQLDHTAVRYLVEPPAEVPRASRRAGESGTVWLRVVVDAYGAPAQVLLHRSSGHPRLDEQALWAMRQARFQPHTDNGRAVEVEVIAPIEYPAD